MKVHATYHDFAGNDKADVWTISEDPESTGWETDSGCDGYGLSKEKAEYYAKCINEYPRLLSIIETAEKALQDCKASHIAARCNWCNDDITEIADRALQVIRGK